MSKTKSGLDKEILCSKKIHGKGIPLLISSQWLRLLGAGQVDLACIYQGQVEIFEIKSKLEFFGRQQNLRLNKSLTILTHIFSMPGVLRVA